MKTFILFLIIAVMTLFVFFFANRTLTNRYYALRGKYQWSLLYFPLLYVLVDMMLLAAVIWMCIAFNVQPLMDQSMSMLFLWSMIALIYLYIVVRYIFTDREELKDMLLYWKDGYERRAKILLTRICVVGAIAPLLYFLTIIHIASQHGLSSVGYIDTHEARELLSDYLIWVAFATVMTAAVIYFGCKRIDSFGEDVNETVVSVSNSVSRSQSAPTYGHKTVHTPQKPVTRRENSDNSVAENLRELRQLHEDGLISSEEYNQLKTSLLNGI